MSIQPQASSSLWTSTAGVSGSYSALQQSAADAAASGNESAVEFVAAMQQTGLVQAQSNKSSAEPATTVAPVGGQSEQAVTGNRESSGAEAEQQNSKQAQKFLDGLMEQLLANRLGLNKKEMDRLKEKITELELKRKELTEQANRGGDPMMHSTAIRQIDAQIAQLQKQLEQLIQENELGKNNPDDDKRREWSVQSLGQRL